MLEDFFDQKTAAEYLSNYGHCDVFILRQVLEHIYDLVAFANVIKFIIKQGSIVLIEVPCFDQNINTYDYSLWEEHVNYFTKKTLSSFLKMIAIEPIHFERFLFTGVGQLVIGRCNQLELGDLTPYYSDASLRGGVVQYANYFNEFKDLFRAFLLNSIKKGKKIAMYGAGARSATFVNFLDISQYIEFVVDDQPEKQNLFMPSSKLEILSRDHLYSENIDVCLLGVNTENEEKVIRRFCDPKKKSIEFYSILPPSKHLPPFWSQCLKSLSQNEYATYL